MESTYADEVGHCWPWERERVVIIDEEQWRVGHNIHDGGKVLAEEATHDGILRGQVTTKVPPMGHYPKHRVQQTLTERHLLGQVGEWVWDVRSWSLIANLHMGKVLNLLTKTENERFYFIKH